MTSVFMRVEGLDCFNQKAIFDRDKRFFITNRPWGAQFILNVFYKKGCQEESFSLDRTPRRFLSRDPAHCL